MSERELEIIFYDVSYIVFIVVLFFTKNLAGNHPMTQYS